SISFFYIICHLVVSLFVAKLNYQFLLHLSLFSHDKLFSQRLAITDLNSIIFRVTLLRGATPKKF
ncbi:hypothetical protein, partial [Wolbachia endosymbiont of Madathamugadia hiepei]|uniref:hypothetical protein n=1 Tax=Wolbachia endosymbiont of Madathamugadia hiepei TaxID=1241303 RepID=UPI001C55605A